MVSLEYPLLYGVTPLNNVKTGWGSPENEMSWKWIVNDKWVLFSDLDSFVILRTSCNNGRFGSLQQMHLETRLKLPQRKSYFTCN